MPQDTQKHLYRWTKGFGRMGDLSGLIVTTTEAIAEAAGERVGFGEVLGKHSDVYYTINADDFELLTDDVAFIAQCVALNILADGFDPLGYVEKECPECGEASPQNEWYETACCKWD